MPEPIEKLYVSIGADIAPLLKDTKKGVSEAERELEKVGNTGKKSFDNLKGGAQSFGQSLKALTSAAVAFVAVFVIQRVKQFFDESIALTKKQQQAEAQLTAALNSTGHAAGLTAAELKAMASELQSVTNIGDEATISAQAMLLTFTNIGRDTFPRATAAILDVATAMNNGATPSTEQLRTTTIQLGKALNDPIKGLAALSRVGIQFTEAQKDQIETLTESGKTVEAQAIILAELERQFGGSAEAAREADGGAIALSNSFGDLREQIGALIQPTKSQNEALVATIDALTGVIGKVREYWDLGNQLIEMQNENASSGEKVLDGLIQYIPIVGQINTLIQPLIASDEQLAEAQATLAEETEGVTQTLQDNTDAIEENAAAQDKIKDALDKAAAGLIDLSDRVGEQREELEQEHTDNLIEIETDYVQKRLDLGAELADELEALDKETAKERENILESAADDLAKLDTDTAKRRRDIFAGAQRALQKLQGDTDNKLSQQQADFQKDELRETQDHLVDMRRLREQFLFNLEDAVKNRDARAVVDLRRRFEMEKKEREENFSTNQQRSQQDQNDTLQRIRENEAQRAQEIIDARQRDIENLMESEAEKKAEIERRRQDDLNNLAENEAEKRQAINDSFAQQQADLDTAHVEQLAKEQSQFEERQTQLDEALARRLETITKELADEQDINARAAEDLLTTLNKTFGAGGDIDQLINDFANRRRQKMIVSIGFESQKQGGSKNAAQAQAKSLSTKVPSFQSGGTLLATRPTLAQFGEVPELVQFTPLSKMGAMGGGGGQRLEVDVKLSGSAPPGVRSADRDAIAGVLVNALREAGVNVKPGR